MTRCPEPAAAASAGADAQLVLDCRGQRCPLPIIALARRIGEVTPGQVIAVLADDPAARSDVPAWCQLRGPGRVSYLGQVSPGRFAVRRIS